MIQQDIQTYAVLSFGGRPGGGSTVILQFKRIPGVKQHPAKKKKIVCASLVKAFKYDKDKVTASSRKRSSGARHFYRLLI